ncbi:unnamed protein product [Chondrus crispus]|uniref:Uncharacterized protein n=1 Tax=Chondrus crispus TaxID=2769 RepID=R7QG69_CHOCR|nr:unnamed protein product [Chondrus crispus]CDF37064.1 unnamed protein product [Chondrus crispus]|eukprot:XP_005716883.1 unnamed protein product [Chondrus crispus]
MNEDIDVLQVWENSVLPTLLPVPLASRNEAAEEKHAKRNTRSAPPLANRQPHPRGRRL